MKPEARPVQEVLQTRAFWRRGVSSGHREVPRVQAKKGQVELSFLPSSQTHCSAFLTPYIRLPGLGNLVDLLEATMLSFLGSLKGHLISLAPIGFFWLTIFLAPGY